MCFKKYTTLKCKRLINFITYIVPNSMEGIRFSFKKTPIINIHKKLTMKDVREKYAFRTSSGGLFYFIGRWGRREHAKVKNRYCGSLESRERISARVIC